MAIRANVWWPTSLELLLRLLTHTRERFSKIVGSPYHIMLKVFRRNYGSKVDVWSVGFTVVWGYPFWEVAMVVMVK
ncbi:hypothetical protein VNO78_35889 [Psophocarpus tetragonolobus]|uniref:Uncharacterized protein n=1 Tax=Psophocarpus tetragonolobus TaxID=3891 RepID=A0AAN9NLI2_PSOTE